MKTPHTWFITGCSTGFGRILSEILLKQGDRVIATARDLSRIQDLETKAKKEQLLLLKLDVTNAAERETAVKLAIEKMGRIDVLVNNAGYGSVGALEEISESEIRSVFEVNVFGLIEMTRLVLPHMRSQRYGHIINLSSVAGMVALPGASIYAATKFAVEGHSEALAGEVAPFGIKVSILEPGAFRTDFANRSLKTAPYHPAYAEALNSTRTYYETIGGQQPGDPIKACEAMIQLVNHSAPPLRLVLGKIALNRIETKLAQYQKEMAAWKDVTLGADY